MPKTKSQVGPYVPNTKSQVSRHSDINSALNRNNVKRFNEDVQNPSIRGIDS